MPKDNTYFEEASKLFHDEDVFIAVVSDIIYKKMMYLHLQRGLSPASPDTFNILYFFQSVIRALLMEHPEVTLTSKRFPYPCERINAVNWPDGSAVLSKDNSATLIRYLDLIRKDSDPFGNEFDVNYSIEIFDLLLCEYEFVNIVNNYNQKFKTFSHLINEDLDDWLSGFVDKQL